MAMHQVEGSFYAVDVQMVWTQNDLGLVQFVDAVWNGQRQCYEVRRV
jgi:hypothetical protein